jgi:undecaprenyl-diphosphatase
MNPFTAALLGLVQGLTEFLPISSSGHLVLAESLLGVRSQGIAFEVALHLATAGAVVLAYRKRIGLILKALPAAFTPQAWRETPQSDPVQRENLFFALYVVLGTLPAGVIGIKFKDFFEEAFASPRLVAWMLLVTGLILFSSRLARHVKVKPLRWHRAILVGCAQAVAIIPGISRSGTTITSGLLLGLGPGRSAEFSFLLALPAILGASLLEAAEIFSGVDSIAAGIWSYTAGCVTAFFSGYLAIYFLLRVLQKGRLDRFAYYCFAVGLTALVFLH